MGLYLRLFGAFQFEDEGGRVISLPTRKTKALLAYLAFHGGQPHERAKLAGLLWGDSSEAQARESLRQALSLLRKALSPRHAHALAARGDTVEIKSGMFRVDAVEFERRIAGADAAGLHDAIQLYQGRFLEGFDLRAAEFEGWLSSVRQQLNEKAVNALNSLLSHHAGAGRALAEAGGEKQSLSAIHRLRGEALFSVGRRAMRLIRRRRSRAARAR